MNRLRIVDANTIEKLLLRLGFARASDKEGATFSTVTLMEGPPQYRTMAEGIWLGP